MPTGRERRPPGARARPLRSALLFLSCGVAGCAGRDTISPSLAQRAFYAPSGVVVLEIAPDGAIEEAAVPAAPEDVPPAARTAIERERPGGLVESVHRVAGGRGVVWRVAKVVLGESVVYEAREDGEILSRAVAVERDGPAWQTAAAACEALDPGGDIAAMSYVAGPLGKELHVTKTRAGAVIRLRLRAAEGGWEKAGERREIEARLRIGSGG